MVGLFALAQLTTTPSKLNAFAAVPAMAATLITTDMSIYVDGAVEHAVLVADVHDSVLHTTLARARVAVSSPYPKLSPETVMDEPPVRTAFGIAPTLTAGTSKLKAALPPVPVTAPTVMSTKADTYSLGAGMHRMRVPVDHDEELHKLSAITALAVKSARPPKFIPVTVIDPPPVRGVLSTAALTTALSKLKATSPVPATDETLITPTAHSTVAELVTHASVVADLQADVLHVPAASDPVGVTSTDPKFKPLTVTDALPLRALFGNPPLATAASKLNAFAPVPATEPTVTAAKGTSRLMPLVRHANVVLDVHDDVTHIPRARLDVDVCCAFPKCSPVTVTDAPPDSALFSSPLLATAPSKLNTLCPVAAYAATVKTIHRS